MLVWEGDCSQCDKEEILLILEMETMSAVHKERFQWLHYRITGSRSLVIVQVERYFRILPVQYTNKFRISFILQRNCIQCLYKNGICNFKQDRRTLFYTKPIRFRPRFIAHPSWGQRSNLFSTMTSRYNILFGPQFVTGVWAQCSCVGHLLQGAKDCFKWCLPNLMRTPLLKQCT